MIKKIEHIGIAIKSSEAKIVFEQLLNGSVYKTEEVQGEKVCVHFFKVGESKLELLESTDDTGVIAKYIERKGEGLHHIALAVDSIESEMKRLKALGFEFIYERPKRGADNQLINFIHPKYTHGVLIELCEDISQV